MYPDNLESFIYKRMDRFLRQFISIFLLSIICFTTSYAQNRYGKTDIADLVLIYQGGVHRPMEWTSDQFLPYVIHKDQKGTTNWLFDGFLFLEFKDGKGKNFVPGYDAQNARKEDWQWLMGRQLEKDKAFSALDQCISQQIKLLGKPEFKHKLIVGIPSPIYNQKDWGEIGGQRLDFSKAEDRLKASKWYIDLFLKNYQNQKYKNIQLNGFYWVDEAVNNDEKLLIDISNYIHSKKLKLYWIPYWKAPGSEKWKSFKFDFAWIQPNHFFDKKVPDSRLNEACDFARQMNMGVEMEFDDRAMADSKAGMSSRLSAYIDAFEQNSVFDKAPIAYYEGGNGIYKFSQSENLQDKALIDRLAAHIIMRKHKSFLKNLH
jgi:hypothetical protein